MANNWFRFKQFTVCQDKAAFKVGTDGVLLGVWADTSGVGSVLDIGTGTGLLALMIAQRCDAEISAIEIDLASFNEARINVAASPWSERIMVMHSSLQEFATEKKFDMIISNPPFFQDSLRPADARKLAPADKGRMNSRHNTLLSPFELVKYSKLLLQPKGRICLIFPVEESRMLKDICGEEGLYLHRQSGIKPTTSLPVKRYLMEFRPYLAGSCLQEELTIEKGKRHDYTDEYRELTKEFYLAF